jgi:hypothetical protein
VLLALALIGFALRARSRTQTLQQTQAPHARAATNPPPASGAPTAATVPASRSATSNLTFQLRPFPVTRTSATCEWTSEDCKDPNVIRRLVHNESDYQRMVEENDRIQRRQLVYRKDPGPLTHTGWQLQVQTNSLTTGLNTNWFAVPGSTTTNTVSLPMDLSNGSVFYRLVYP